MTAISTVKPKGLHTPPMLPSSKLYEMIPHDVRASPYSRAGHLRHHLGVASIDDKPGFWSRRGNRDLTESHRVGTIASIINQLWRFGSFVPVCNSREVFGRRRWPYVNDALLHGGWGAVVKVTSRSIVPKSNPIVSRTETAGRNQNLVLL